MGLLLGKMKGIDIREHGSKNIGATNTGRVLGFRYAVITYAFDMFKGAILVFLFRFGIIPMEYCLCHPLLYGLAAALGHTAPIYIKFKGGKAVATSSGIIFGYCPWLLIVGMVIFFIILLITKYVSLSSIISTFLVLIITYILAIIGHDPIYDYQYTWHFSLFTTIIFIIVIIRHKSNIIRLINKSENKVSLIRKEKQS
jgi:glycerol-3-phosphate acyltransferase PlsY